MPNALIPLPDVYESVTRRVAVDVIAQLSRTLRLPGNTEVYLPGNTDSVPMNGGTFGECWDPGVRYPAEARLVVRFNEAINEDNALTATVNKPQQMPVFWDEPRDVVIRPVYRYVNMTVTIEYVAPNITLAQRWLDHMRSQYSMGRAELYQDLEYHYAIPTPVMYLLKHLHETMEASPTPTGQTFDEYFEQHRFAPVKTATTLSGSSPTRVIPEHQYEVLGWFDFTATPPTPEKDGNDTGTYTTGFSYHLHYNRPVQLYCKYPMLIHNNPVDREFRPTAPYTTFRSKDRRVSSRKGSFDAILAQMEATGVPYIHYPAYDDWIPASIPKERLTFFTGLLVITPDDPYTLMNLANLGDFAFSPFFLEYFYTIGTRALAPDTGIFEFRLYENNTLKSLSGFELEGVTVKSTQPLDPTKYYHLQISLKRNWIAVSPDTIQCLRRYPTVAYWTLKAIGVTLGNQPLPLVKRLGESRPRTVSATCPGEGSIIGPPRSSYTPPTGVMTPPPGWADWPGGQWPWPWLGESWIGVPWPGSVPDGWLETPWPDFNMPGTYPPGMGYPPGTPIPDGVVVWPGMYPYPDLNNRLPENYPGSPDYPYWLDPGYADLPYWGSFPSGVITDKDMQEAVRQTDRYADQRNGRNSLGTMTVLYSEILTAKP